MLIKKRIRAISFFTAAVFLGCTATLDYSFARGKKQAMPVGGPQPVTSSIEENSEMAAENLRENGESAASQPEVLEKAAPASQMKKKKKFP